MFQKQSNQNGQTHPHVSNSFSKTLVAPTSLSATLPGPSRTGGGVGVRSLGSTTASKPTLTQLPKPLNKSDEPQFLKAAFKIGSTHGRINFENEERVFHRSDVPEKAREAHAYITNLLQTNLLTKQNSVWDSSISSGVAIKGSKHCSWETTADTFDDRYYHNLQSQYLVNNAKRRVDLIRSGVDPDFDNNNINPRWNVSTLVEENGPSALGSKAGAAAELSHSRRIKHLPKDHKSLITLQTDLNLRTRAAKDERAKEVAGEAALQASWNKWQMSEHVDGPPTLPALPSPPRDIEGIAKSIDQEYASEALQTFLWQQEHPEEAAKAGMKPLKEKSARSHAVKPTVHHLHRTEQSLERDSLPYSSAVPPAWYRVEARAAQVAQSRAEAPFPRFAHPGAYLWEPTASDGITSSQEHKEWTVGDELSAAGGAYRWSCCLHPLRDSRGCTAVDTDPSKRRIVVARSDDPTSVAAMGFSSSKRHTTSSHGLDASHVRARSDAAAAATHAHAAPVVGGTSAVVGTSSGMGLSGPGVAIVTRLAHTGLYQSCPATRELMWSCCGAGESNAPGCIAKSITKEHRWMVDSA